MTTQDHPDCSAQNILLLAGGPSAEREISLKSGAAVANALRSRGCDVFEFDPHDGTLNGVDSEQFDVAFIALHGKFGEDGQVQSLLEALNLPYTGSDVHASQCAMSKIATKKVLSAHSLPTPEFRHLHPSDSAEEIQKKAATLGYPLVVKPDAEGSSLGVSMVPTALDLPAALSQCFQYGPIGLMESCITGQEWTVGLIGETVLPPIQILSQNHFYDFSAKYHSSDTQYLFESYLPDSVLETMQHLALKACQKVGTQGIARVDFRLDRFFQPWILEINTIPGMTSHSLIPKAAEKIGISLKELCEIAVQSAIHPSRHSMRPAA